jgi:putative NADPH-quinone reductase
MGMQDFTLNDKLHHVTWSTLHFIGFNVIQPFNTYGISPLTEEEKFKSMLYTLREAARTIAE